MTGIQVLLDKIISTGASDLHLNPGRPPVGRVKGHLVALTDETLDDAASEMLCREVCDEKHWQEIQDVGSTDFAIQHPGGDRFRASVFRQRGRYSAVMRLIPSKLLSFDDIGLPEVCRDLLRRPRGLVLITGPTGSGKTTTLATMIDWINQNQERHIITIEDPV